MVALQLILDCHSFSIPNKKLFLVLRNGYMMEKLVPSQLPSQNIARLTMR
jgi:hypothetical protein